tara:strand:+ start:50 stop:268 length:219 start_codon:yes stop_codon:yes gene_type:complete
MNSAYQNLLTLIGGIFSIYIAYLTAQGILQNYISFQDPLNEMAFFMCALFMGVSCIYIGIPQRHWNKLNPFS